VPCFPAGGFGKVYLGELNGTEDVAVKVRPSISTFYQFLEKFTFTSSAD